MTDTIATQAKLGVRRLAGNIGAEITGVDTGTDLGDDAIAQIRQALLDHKVVFLRGQNLDYARQVAFAERLGPLTLGHPTLASPPDQPLLEEIDSRKGGRANSWHTDVTFVDRPPAFTLLHAVVIPPVGGDTLWANTVTAYESLPEELRDLADRLRIVHTNDSRLCRGLRPWRARRRGHAGGAAAVPVDGVRDRASGGAGASRRPGSARWCWAGSRAPCWGSRRRRPGT